MLLRRSPLALFHSEPRYDSTLFLHGIELSPMLPLETWRADSLDSLSERDLHN